MNRALALVDKLLSSISQDDKCQEEKESYPLTDLSRNMKWLNKPSESSSIRIQPDSLTFKADLETDFWITTDITRHSGHFYYVDAVSDNFVMYTEIVGEYGVLYDQAGLMILKDANNWIKTGIEFMKCQQVSAVVTKSMSDWNVTPC